MCLRIILWSLVCDDKIGEVKICLLMKVQKDPTEGKIKKQKNDTCRNSTHNQFKISFCY
jgi:hypothetical protein